MNVLIWHSPDFDYSWFIGYTDKQTTDYMGQREGSHFNYP